MPDLESSLDALRASYQYRELTPIDPTAVPCDSNDYLGLSHHPDLIAAGIDAVERFGTGSTGSRLLSGNYPLLDDLEQHLETLTRRSCLLFNSGYHLNTGLLPALTTKEDVIFADKHAHASLIDGARLSPARLIRYRHQDVDQLRDLLRERRARYRHAIIVTESLFSMDGTRADLDQLIDLKYRYTATLLVDEAHSIGCFGPNGMGIAEDRGCYSDIDLVVGTFGKAFASMGAFLACDPTVKDYLINRCRSLIYSTALPPFAAGVIYHLLNQPELLTSRQTQLAQLTHTVRQWLQPLGSRVLGTDYIVPILTHTPRDALALSDTLRHHGFIAPAIRHPTVPKGTDRLRLSLKATLEPSALRPLAEILINALH